MAKLTARFDMQDKVSKKMKALQGNLESVERSRKKLEKPLVLKAKDEASKKLKTIHGFIKKDLAKHTVVVALNDQLSKSVNKLSNFIERRMPRTHSVIIKAQDRTKTVFEKINRYLGKNLLGIHMLTIMAKDKASSTVQKIGNYTKRLLSKGYNFTVEAFDKATKTVGRIASYSSSAIGKHRNFTVRAIDKATRTVGTIKNALFSIPSMITVTLGVIGVNKLGESTIGSAMNFEGYKVGMKHWLNDNEEQANELISWMGRFADSTPFSSADLFPALSRGIGVSGGDVKQAQKLLEISSNMASLTPGKTVSDAMEALADANMGEFERMKEFNMKITQDDFKSVGWAGIIKEIDSTFKDGAKKFSQTASGQIATLKGYASTIFREAGVGILESMKPRLDSITTWIDNNQDKWGEWKATVQQAGEEGAEWVFSKLEGAFSYIRDNYLENDDFKNLDFEGKVKFIMDDLGGWWDKTGRPLLVEVSKEVGQAIFQGVTWGIKEGLKSIGTMWVDAFKNPSVESFAGAGIATALAGSLATIVLAPLIKGIGGIYKAGKWFWDRGKDVTNFFGKGKGKGPQAPVPPVTGGSGKTPTTTGQPKGGFFANLFDKGTQATLNTPNAFKNVKEVGKHAKFGKGLGAVAKRVPVLSTLLGVGTIMAAPEGQKGQAVGNVGGGLGGAAIGAAIGSVIPGVGTVIGGILGGIAGSIGGGKLGSLVDDNWEAIKSKASEAATAVGNAFGTAREKISSTIFSGEWWGEKWDGVKSWTSEKWASATDTWNTIQESISSTIFSGDWWSEKWNGIKELTTSTIFSAGWWAEQAGFVYGYLESTIFSGEWWSEKWEAVKEVTAGTMFAPAWWGEKWEGVKAWTQEKWDSAVVVWESVKTKFAETVFNSEWWYGKWESVKGWTQEKWDAAQTVWTSVTTKINDTIFNSEWWGSHWESVKGWTQEKWDSAQEIWDSAKTALGNTLFDGEWWKGKWEDVEGWAQEKLSGIGSWVSGLIEDTKERFSEGREKGNKSGKGAKEYARGGLITRPHLGLVGEAGPEMIIPLSANRRDRAMDLYSRTGEILGVRPYANGGQVGGNASLPKPPSAQAAQVSLNVGITTQGITKEAELYGQSFSNAVATGINSSVVPINSWKKNNIENPMRGVIKDAVGFGSSTVASFSVGQNATSTNTTAYLDRQVKSPFKVIEGGASSWGTGTINGFRTGQNATSTGTSPYLATNVHAPFNETKAKGTGWGSGTLSEFVSGMMSKTAQVKEAAQHLAKQVEKTFKEELGIHSPSRVMAKLGEFASLGIVKGLGAVDVKKFAEKQAGSLAAAFSGLGAVGGNVSQWLQAAMMITGVPSSWLGPLGIIAQKESGGNPRAINLWDSNAKKGTPSKGLMQTIDPTFNAYKKPGMNDIWNPIHNAVAAINYIKSRYGSVFNTPGIRSMARGGGYKGYAKGGKVPNTQWAWVGEEGPELMRLPGGAEIFPHDESMRMASDDMWAEQVAVAIGSGGKFKAASGKVRDIIIQITGDNHFYNEKDLDNFVAKVKRALEEILIDEYNEGGELVVYE